MARTDKRFINLAIYTGANIVYLQEVLIHREKSEQLRQSIMELKSKIRLLALEGFLPTCNLKLVPHQSDEYSPCDSWQEAEASSKGRIKEKATTTVTRKVCNSTY